jgi:forkhead protein FKH
MYSLADDIIRNLRVAQYQVMAETDFNNTIVDKSAQAFAKIAGREWTYYVAKLKVIFGRPNNKKSTITSPPSATSRPLADMAVDIDLGPDQQVSRLHAEIAFDADAQKWFIFANGRNGVYIDNQRLEAGERAWLHSGCVIGIIGTQMIFLLPGTAPVIHPDIRRQLLPDYEEESEAEGREDKTAPPPGSGRGRGRGAQAVDPAHVASNGPRGQQYATAPDGTQLSPGTPLSRLKEPIVPKSKPSPTYGRGLMMESTEDIDYSLDSAKDIKPPHSYAAMIGQAILSTPEENATLAKIYEFIKERYAYFRHSQSGWQNSIRHNLSLSKCFQKIPRRTDEPGKGMKWQIVPEFREEFMKKNIQPVSVKRRQTSSSMPTSPLATHPNSGAAAQTERLMGVLGESNSRGTVKSRSETPPLGALGDESYTPERGPPTFAGNLHNVDSHHDGQTATPSTISKSERVTPLYDRIGVVRFAGPSQVTQDGQQSTAPLTSPPAMNLGSSTGYDTLLVPPGSSNLFTPLPRTRFQPLGGTIGAGLQSTCKAPSFYAKELLSSPAPFWKYIDIGPTTVGQVRLPEESPIRSPSKEDEEDDDGLPVESSPVKRGKYVADSSPPGVMRSTSATSHPDDPMDLDSSKDVSPTRTVSRPVSRHLATDPMDEETLVVNTNAPEIKSETADAGGETGPSTPIKRSPTTSPVKFSGAFPQLQPKHTEPHGLGQKNIFPARIQVDEDEEGS